MNSMIGTVFHNRYEILSVLGSGGTSVVYKAKDTVLNRLVTLKILREPLDKDDKFLNRFRHEAQAVAKLSHPNIVNIYDVANAGGVQYLVMEYVEGCSLKEYLDNSGPLAVEEALNIFQQLLLALSHAHENNVIHRDIKPHNILLDTKHNVRVTDFGLAITAEDMTIDAAEESGSDIMGSVYYMSPEQIKGETVSAATDIYSAGVLLYEMLCGERPFGGDNAVEIARQHLKGMPIAPHKINPTISTELSSFVMKAIRRDKELRFANASQMLSELKSLQNKNRRLVVKSLNLDFTPIAADSGKTEDERTVVVKRHVSIPQEKPKKWQFFRDKKPTPLFLAAVIAVLLIMVLFASLASIFNSLNSSNTEVEVRNFVGMNLAEAEQLIEKDGLKCTVSYSFSSEYANNLVIRQNINAGQKVKTGRFIELTVSQGSQTFTMPSIKEMTLSQARVLLSKYDVTIESEDVVDDSVAAGQIISQEPEEGAEIAAGATVKVTISKGREIAVPDLKGRTEDDAMVYLVIQGLTLGNITREESHEYDEGIVIGQSLTPGDTAPEGSGIDLVVSSGPGPAGKTVRLTYTLPAGDISYRLTVEVTDNKGTHDEYTGTHSGGETIVRDVEISGSGTVKVYLDGEVVYSQDVN